MALNKLHGFRLLTLQLETTEESGSLGYLLEHNKSVWRNTRRRAETLSTVELLAMTYFLFHKQQSLLQEQDAGWTH